MTCVKWLREAPKWLRWCHPLSSLWVWQWTQLVACLHHLSNHYHTRETSYWERHSSLLEEIFFSGQVCLARISDKLDMPKNYFLWKQPSNKKWKGCWLVNKHSNLWLRVVCWHSLPHGTKLQLPTVVSELLMRSLLICFSPTGDFWNFLLTKLLIFESLPQNQLLEEALWIHGLKRMQR